jgi:hypothetical protein
MRCRLGGEGGIRTHGALRLTRSPGARVRPDYATSPIFTSILLEESADYIMTSPGQPGAEAGSDSDLQ